MQGLRDSRISARTARANGGFTLTEIMVVVVLLGVLVGGVMTSFAAQKKSAAMNSQLVDAQHTSRLLGDLLEDDIRHAGLLVPESGAICAIDRTLLSDSFYVSDAGAIDPTVEIRNDLGARVTAGATGGDNVAGNATPATATLTVTNTLTLDALTVEQANPTAAYDTDGNGVADSDFQVGGGVIITDAANPTRGSACGVVRGVTIGTSVITIGIESDALGPMPLVDPNPVDLVAIPAHQYQINTAFQLVRNGTAVADDVEDLQIAVFVDLNDDRVIDAGEYRGDGVGANLNPSGLDMSLAREVRANLVIRTRLQDQDNGNGRFQDSENRAAIGTADGFRRRAYSATVMLRNVGTRAVTS
jgi:prepilin-type N-terminal cleavage/methylation domain-containing protein